MGKKFSQLCMCHFCNFVLKLPLNLSPNTALNQKCLLNHRLPGLLWQLEPVLVAPGVPLDAARGAELLPLQQVVQVSRAEIRGQISVLI